jgi:hypothetical protein
MLEGAGTAGATDTTTLVMGPGSSVRREGCARPTGNSFTATDHEAIPDETLARANQMGVFPRTGVKPVRTNLCLLART